MLLKLDQFWIWIIFKLNVNSSNIFSTLLWDSNRDSLTIENAVKEVIEMLKSPLTSSELEKVLKPPSRETDAYSAIMSYFAQRNTDAFIKCEYLISHKSLFYYYLDSHPFSVSGIFQTLISL